MFEHIKSAFTKEYWSLKNIAHSRNRRYLFKQVRIFSLAIKGFNEDRVSIRASALTYYTLLSIVPIAALAFGIAQGFGIDEKLNDYINQTFKSQKEVALWIISFADKYLKNISGGAIAGVGVLVLIWTVMRLLSNIEVSFNDIWQIKKSRVMSRKFSDYISLVVVAPVLIVASSGVTVFLGNQFEEGSTAFPLLAYLGPVLGVLTTIIPLILVWMVFTLLYIVMPNTKVTFNSALVGGVLGGTMYQIFQWGYVTFQKELFNYGEVYGSFAALPLFLIWLQLSWLIVLFGAEIAFANQNVEHYEAESGAVKISNHTKRSVSLAITSLIAKNFRDGVSPMTAEDIANKLDIAIRLVRDIIYELLEIGIITETLTQNVKESAYQPAMDPTKVTIGYVIDKLDKRGNDQIISTDNIELQKINKLVDSFTDDMHSSKSNKMLLDI